MPTVTTTPATTQHITTAGVAAVHRNLNADLVAQTLRAQRQQRPLVRAASQPQAYVVLPCGSIVRREEWVPTEQDRYQQF